MNVTLAQDAQQMIERHLRSHRFPDAESVILAGLYSLNTPPAGEFDAGEMTELLAAGERSIRESGTLDADKAFEGRRKRHAAKRRK